MFITLCTEEGGTAHIEVDYSTDIATLKALASVELNIESDCTITFRGVPLPDSAVLGSSGVQNNDLLMVLHQGPLPMQVVPPVVAAPREVAATLADLQSGDPKVMLAFFEKNPRLLRALHHENPKLAEAVETKDEGKIRTCVMIQQMENHKARWENQQVMAKLDSDPDSEESQKKLFELIQKQQIDRNYVEAMEDAPEVFGRVTMLYIPTVVNGRHPVKAFVDSGAQMTNMTLACAKASGLEHLIDKRFAGEARGVGTCKILGRVHMANLRLGENDFTCSFHILEGGDVEFLFGLDMLKRHQCVIDLKESCLRIGTGNVTVPFLSESELPESAREALMKPNDLDETKAIAAQNKREREEQQQAGGATSTSSSGAGVLPPPPAQQNTANSNMGGALQQLMALGFSRAQCEGALQSANGDVQQAAALLMAQF